MRTLPSLLGRFESRQSLLCSSPPNTPRRNPRDFAFYGTFMTSKYNAEWEGENPPELARQVRIPAELALLLSAKYPRGEILGDFAFWTGQLLHRRFRCAKKEPAPHQRYGVKIHLPMPRREEAKLNSKCFYFVNISRYSYFVQGRILTQTEKNCIM